MLWYIFAAIVIGLLGYIIWCSHEAYLIDLDRWQRQQRINTGLIALLQEHGRTTRDRDILRAAEETNRKM